MQRCLAPLHLASGESGLHPWHHLGDEQFERCHCVGMVERSPTERGERVVDGRVSGDLQQVRRNVVGITCREQALFDCQRAIAVQGRIRLAGFAKSSEVGGDVVVVDLPRFDRSAPSPVAVGVD